MTTNDLARKAAEEIRQEVGQLYTIDECEMATAIIAKHYEPLLRNCLDGFDALAREATQKNDDRFLGYVLMADKLRLALSSKAQS